MNCYLSGEPPWLALKSCLVFVVAWLHPQVIRAGTELGGREKTSNLCATDRVVRTIPDLSHFSRYRPRNLGSFAAPWLTDTKNRDDRVWDWKNIDKNGLFHMNWARNTGKLDLFVETYKQVPLGLMVGTQRFTKCKRIHITQIAVNSWWPLICFKFRQTSHGQNHPSKKTLSANLKKSAGRCIGSALHLFSIVQYCQSKLGLFSIAHMFKKQPSKLYGSQLHLYGFQAVKKTLPTLYVFAAQPPCPQKARSFDCGFLLTWYFVHQSWKIARASGRTMLVQTANVSKNDLCCIRKYIWKWALSHCQSLYKINLRHIPNR